MIDSPKLSPNFSMIDWLTLIWGIDDAYIIAGGVIG